MFKTNHKEVSDSLPGIAQVRLRSNDQSVQANRELSCTGAGRPNRLVSSALAYY